MKQLWFFTESKTSDCPKAKIIALKRDCFIDVNCNNQNLIIPILM